MADLATRMRRRQLGERMRMVDENRIASARPGHAGPMSRGELYRWHLRNGTLDLFFAMFPMG